MKKAKLIKTNKAKEKQIEKDSYSLKNLIFIVLILIVVFGIFYFITTLVVDPIVDENSDTNGITEFDSTKITLNNLLDRKEDEYYVLATKQSNNNQIDYLVLYNNYINNYSSEENSLPFYNVDLDDALNKNFIGEELNITNEISELKLNNDVLFKIQDNEIEKYFVGSKDIIEALSNL